MVFPLKLPFSYGFPMVFPLKLPFSHGLPKENHPQYVRTVQANQHLGVHTPSRSSLAFSGANMSRLQAESMVFYGDIMGIYWDFFTNLPTKWNPWLLVCLSTTGKFQRWQHLQNGAPFFSFCPGRSWLITPYNCRYMQDRATSYGLCKPTSGQDRDSTNLDPRTQGAVQANFPNG